MLTITKTFGLFLLTAVAELLCCYLPILWLSGKASTWMLLLAALSLLVFVWLLTLHPIASGRVYAAYSAVYIATAIFWLWRIDGITPQWSDLLGTGLALAGAAVITLGART